MGEVEYVKRRPNGAENQFGGGLSTGYERRRVILAWRLPLSQWAEVAGDE